MKKETKEVVALVQEYNDKLAKITDNYKNALSKLDKIGVELEKQRASWLYVYRNPIIVFLIIVALIVADKFINWQTINILDLIEITRK